MKRWTAISTALVMGALASLTTAQGGKSRPFGKGCPSGQIDAWGWAPHPGLGDLTIYGVGRVPRKPAITVLGTSDKRWGAFTLPLPLDPLGLKGCSIYTDLAVLVPVIANDKSQVQTSFRIPNVPALANLELFAQFLGLQDPRVNAAVPLTTSSAVALRIGTVVPFTGYRVVGDPTTANGAEWYMKELDKTTPLFYDLAGRLWRPKGSPPPGGFPAVILSHGGGGGVDGYARAMAQYFVSWGFVCIAPVYTHVNKSVPLGSPGTYLEPGGYPANVHRVRIARGALIVQRYVNMSKVALHGNSNGGFVTIAACASALGARIRVASHTASGIDDTRSPQWPSTATADKVRVPYIVQHGDKDTTVPVKHDADFVAILNKNNVAHRFIVWKDRAHGLGSGQSPVLGQVLANVRLFFRQHGVF